ncbi:MAG TPA: hypothetical protein VJH90_03945 [archaeon]|nr:hypothetical protein [archaeon]
MDFKVIEQKENQLLKRKDLVLDVDFQGGATPSKLMIQGKLAEQMKVNPELVEISRIISSAGEPKGVAVVKIWETKPPEKKKKGTQQAPAQQAEAKPAA